MMHINIMYMHAYVYVMKFDTSMTIHIQHTTTTNIDHHIEIHGFGLVCHTTTTQSIVDIEHNIGTSCNMYIYYGCTMYHGVTNMNMMNMNMLLGMRIDCTHMLVKPQTRLTDTHM